MKQKISCEHKRIWTYNHHLMKKNACHLRYIQGIILNLY